MSENTEQLQSYGIYDLRRILRSLGGTPGTKSKSQIIEDIIKIRETGETPTRSPRGRKAVKIHHEDFSNEITQNSASVENDTCEEPDDLDDETPYDYNKPFESSSGFGESPAYTTENDTGYRTTGNDYYEVNAAQPAEKTSYNNPQYNSGNPSYNKNNARSSTYIGNNSNYKQEDKPRAQYNQRTTDKNRNQRSEGNRYFSKNNAEKKDEQTVAGVKFNEPERTEKSDCVSGVLELHVDGYGFLRANNYESSPVGDTFLSRQQVKYFGLRRGDFVIGKAEKTRETGSSSLTEVISVNGLPPRTPRKNFDDLIPCYPEKRITLERKDISGEFTLRMMDLLCPLGKGQRGLVVAPPKTGKTTLLKNVAQSIETNHPDVHLIVLLIDERPEEVTDLKSSINGEVVYSTFDEPPEHHIRAAELVMWRAKRLVELGKDVVILLDSITRLTRAYNQVVPTSGKILSGGIDPAALQLPKKFFGAARNTKEGGSLTILATALIDTGSKMDDVIYEEFKGTGNMEIHLTRELAERRIFPAFDLFRSGTRKEELLLTKKELDCSFAIHRFISKEEGVETLIGMIGRTESNEEFVSKFPAWIKLMEK